MKRVLVLSPHTDDETLGCGGLIHHVRTHGGEVFIALFSHGGAGIKWKPDGYEKYSNSKRLGEFFSAVATLGVPRENVMMFCEGEDTVHHKMDTVPLGDLVSFIEKCMIEVKPDTILAPFAGYDQDHIAVNHASRVVRRPHFFNGTVLEYSVGSESDFLPNSFLKLENGSMVSKMEAFSRYETQAVKDSHLLSANQIKTLASRHGAFVDAEFAEGFIVRRLLV